MFVGHEWDCSFRVITGTSIQAVMELSRSAVEGSANLETQTALDEIGDTSGETWLHLLGLCMELGEPASLDQLIDHIRAMDPIAFRLVLLGLRAWSWRSIVGAETIEAAAEGDPSAAKRLLDDDRYYGQNAAQALSKVLAWDAEETKEKFLGALEAFRAASDVETLSEALEAATKRIVSMAESEGWLETIVILTGFRYLPEPEARRIVLMPHVAGPSLVLAQHDDARLIAYGDSPELDVGERMVSLGKALSDASRIQLLQLLASGPKQLGELLDETGLTRSTVHHHLRQLRQAGLVSVQGNARSYHYRISREGRHAAVVAITELLGLQKEGDEES